MTTKNKHVITTFEPGILTTMMLAATVNPYGKNKFAKTFWTKETEGNPREKKPCNIYNHVQDEINFACYCT